MTEVDAKKYYSEEQLPLLSLKTRVNEETQDAQETKEQEELWARSLEFFEDMKKASNA